MRGSLIFDARTVALCEQIEGRISEIDRQLQNNLNDSQQSTYAMPALDVLEIAAGVSNSVRATVKQRRGRAIVYNQVKQLGSCPESAAHLWKILQFYEPKHVWVDVQHPWQQLPGHLLGLWNFWQRSFCVIKWRVAAFPS